MHRARLSLEYVNYMVVDCLVKILMRYIFFKKALLVTGNPFPEIRKIR